MFQTNPGEFVSQKRKSKRSEFDLKEEVVIQLMRMDVPINVAETAVIDLREYIIDGHRNKQHAEVIAKLMMPDIQRIYRRRLSK